MNIVFSFLVFLSSSFLWANPYDQLPISTQLQAEQLWKRYFNGNPSQVFTPILQKKDWELNTYINDYEACKKQVDSVFALMNRYDEAFRANNRKLYESSYGKLSTLLSQSGSCLEATRTAYLVSSVIMGPVVQRVISTDFTLGNDVRFELALLVLQLRNLGVIQILDQPLREKLAEGKKDSPWLEKLDGHYQLTAFYGCVESKIYLDKDLKPFNMATSLYHELDHLYRDKQGHLIFRKDENASVLGYKVPGLVDDKMEEFLAFDEMSATIMGGFYQRRFLITNDKEFDQNHSGNEFNFYQVNGPLDEAADYLMSFNPLNADTKELFSSPMSLSIGLGLRVREGDKKALRFFCDMYGIISEGYFGKTNVGCDSLSEYIWSPSISVGYILAKLNIARSYWPSPQGYDFMDVYEEIIKFLDLIETFDDQPSLVCNKIVKSQKEGNLDHYIGTRISPGGKNGNMGIRPCLRVHF